MYSSTARSNYLPSLPRHAGMSTPAELHQLSITSDHAARSAWTDSATSSPTSNPQDRDDHTHHYNQHQHQREQHHRLSDRPQAAPYPSPHGRMYEGISDGATSPVDVGSTTRSVIPSKRAAQNRAAQRAFRQRRDKYVKDLERKVKEMEGWPEEIEQLRNENRQLRDKVAAMHLQIAKLVGQTPTSMMSASSASSIGSADMGQPCQQQYQHHHQPSVQHHPLLVEAAPVAVASPPTSPPDRSPPPPPASFKSTHTIPPVSLRTSHNLSVAPAGSSHSEGGYAIAPVMEQHVNRDEIWALDNFELEFAFDSYFQDDAKPMTTGVDSGIHQQHQHQPNMNNNSGQVLDNLFEMLQTRQRPQIPIRSSSTVDLHPFLPSQTTSYVIPVPPSGSCYH